MDDQLHDTLKSIQSDLTDVKVDLSAMKQDVAYHIRRSDAADASLQLLRDDVKPIQTHVAMVEGALKLIGGISIVVGVIATLLQIFKG